MFEKALPIWAKGREKEKNLALTFRFVFGAKRNDEITVRIACCSVYAMYVNGVFEAFGPARAAKGCFRQDNISLKNLKDGENVLCITVAGYNINSFCTIDQSAFLCAEVLREGSVVACTDERTVCREFKEKTQKIQRYSYQRNFAEHYILDDAYYAFLLGSRDYTAAKTELCTGGRFLERKAPYPLYGRLMSQETDCGKAVFNKRDEYKRDRSLTRPGTGNYKGYAMDELHCIMSDEAQDICFQSAPVGEKLCGGEYRMYSFPRNASGFISAEIDCKESAQLYICFDEILTNGAVSTTRLDCCNVIKLTLEKGRYPFVSFEPYTMKYAAVAVKSGCVRINSLELIEYKHAPADYDIAAKTDDPMLREIALAAQETFAQNAVDIFTDCPSRERAGWLCDSFFMGRVERMLYKTAAVERDFLENYMLPDAFDFLPDGMVSMCYPADHVDGNYIPTWAMWLMLEVYEYYRHSGDNEILQGMRRVADKLCAFFEGYENEDGLLERLDKWVFVEWSAANDFVQDVNYPVNMLYYAFLNCVAALYGRDDLKQKAKRLKGQIRKKAFNGQFFVDNAVYDGNGVLENTDNITEVCQYYAFFCGVADRESYPRLFDTLLHDFGPGRKESGKYKEVHFANAFIGNYLRLEILHRYGEYQKLIEDIKGYFYPMARKTGTLWEHDDTHASCCHGFASHVLYWLGTQKE